MATTTEQPKESFRERQIQELEVIKAIYGADVEVLRPSCDIDVPASQWKPTEIRISLTPLRDSSDGFKEAYARTKLHIICPSKYPKIAPKVLLEESKGLSDQLVEQLLHQLQEQSEQLRGEVMIYNLAQTVQTFLLKYNKPPRGSFYDEMLQENQKREQERLNEKELQEKLKRQKMIEEVERHKEMLNNDAKRRGEPRRSMSESTYRASSSESSENSSPYNRGHYYPNKCLEHRNSEILYFYRAGRQVQRGCCLGHSKKGFVAYTGIDINSGQLLYVTEWTIKYSQLEQKCGNGGGLCYWSTTEPKCNGNHRVDDVMNSIEKQVISLAQLHHKNLVQYECVLFKKCKEGLIVYLLQDFLLGTSVLNISTSLGWCIDGVRMVARGVLDALVYLHNKGVSHGLLTDSTVFMDNTGTLRCTDYSLVPNLLELVGGNSGQQRSVVVGDLPALGALIEALMTAHTYEMRDFIDRCTSNRTLSASELLDHPFLHHSAALPAGKEDKMLALAQQMPRRISGGAAGAPGAPGKVAAAKVSLQVQKVRQQQHQQQQLPVAMSTMPLMAISQSRLRNEFELITYLGHGAFGAVLKVRNILDNRQYALKRISLQGHSRQFYKKMTREVELLSRLNHENVVRYFNSWIENVTEAEMKEMNKLIGEDVSTSSNDTSCKPPTPPLPQLAAAAKEVDDSESSAWSGCLPNAVDSDSSDGIEFAYSNGELANYEDDEDDDDGDDNDDKGQPIGDTKTLSKQSAKLSSPKPMQLMYIQMEFCEKHTLRTAIDNNLYEDTDRLWRLFREIAEGLSYIHQQGIIHRDLKPVNIFLDSHDQIKIGDFGLATTSSLASQNQQEHINPQSHTQMASMEDGTGTGKVGTTLYVAPELTEKASKSTYNQKVDMYTLGIILFEMSQPPFSTGMERVQTIVALRTAAIVIPEAMLKDKRYEKTVKLLRWLLNHDPAHRPTAEELLASELVPPAQLEANELQEMIRHAVANPQSKAYKHLVARCLQQESDLLLEYTYHLGSSRFVKSWHSPITLDSLVTLNPILECVKTKVIAVFRKHGAIAVEPPLLTPLSPRTNPWTNPVRLMTHSGCVVVLPSDLRTEFARYITMNGVNMIRRYCVDRVYREEKVFNFHPKQVYECAYDIITPYASGGGLVDAELLALAYEIAKEIPGLNDKNARIRITHTNLLRAILLHCNVPKSSYAGLFANIADFKEGRISKFQFDSAVKGIMEKTRSSASTLSELLVTDFFVSGGTRSFVEDTLLKSLTRGKGEAASLAKSALRELEAVVGLAKSWGVRLDIYIYAGVPISFDRNIGIVWQLLIDLKRNRYRTKHSTVLAMGERYDTLLTEYQKQTQGFDKNIPERVVSGAGLTFSLDKLVAAIVADNVGVRDCDCRAIDVGVCVYGTRPPLKDVTAIMSRLWAANIRCCVVESAGMGEAVDEAQDLAKLGALHVILVAENGALRIRSWERDRQRFQERHVTSRELNEFIDKLRAEVVGNNGAVDYVSQLSNSGSGGGGGGGTGGGSSGSSGGLSNSASNTNLKSNPSQWPAYAVFFNVNDKLTANFRRRYENQVAQQMSTTLSQFSKKENVFVLVVELPPIILNAIVGAINPREADAQETRIELNNVIERFPKHKRYISDITSQVIGYLNDDKVSIVALYTISDSYYRVII